MSKVCDKLSIDSEEHEIVFYMAEKPRVWQQCVTHLKTGNINIISTKRDIIDQ